MIRRDTIVLASGYNFDRNSASALRALGLAALFNSLGYRAVAIGKFPETGASHGGRKRVFDGISCYDIRQPITGRSFPSYVVSADSIMALVDRIGADRVRAVLAYNYPARGAASLIAQARERGIATILDCTEWYGWEGRKFLRNLHRQIGVHIRMRILTRLAGNVICASSWLQRRLEGQNCVVLPFAFDTDLPRWRRSPFRSDESRPVQFLYSGSPGVGLYKDRLPLLVEALAQLVNEGRDFRFTAAGLTRADYLETVPEHEPFLDRLGSRVEFLGRVAHDKSLDLLRAADFSVFFRQVNRMTNVGFPTKYAEAATLGVPVICNATSDIPAYLEDGRNGFLAEGISSAAVEGVLRRALEQSPAERRAMREECNRRNPFALEHWRDRTREFLAALRGIDG